MHEELITVIISSDMQACLECSQTKLLTEYYNKKGMLNGHDSKCKSCRKIERREEHLKDPRKRMLTDIKKRCNKNNIPFNIIIDDIVIPEKCPVLGIIFKINENIKGFDSPTVDRIIPKLGYIKDNIRVISDRANTLKNNGTIAEHRAILKRMKYHEEIRLCQNLKNVQNVDLKKN